MSNQKTYQIDAGVVTGDAVVLQTAGQYARGADGNPLGGVCAKAESDGYGTIITGGEAVVTYTGALNSGIQQLFVDGTGKVKAGNAGPHFHVVIVNTVTKKARITLPWG